MSAFVVVPSELQQKMHAAAMDAMNRYAPWTVDDLYRAMLAARPTGPEVPLMIEASELEALRRERDEAVYLLGDIVLCFDIDILSEGMNESHKQKLLMLRTQVDELLKKFDAAQDAAIAKEKTK